MTAKHFRHALDRLGWSYVDAAGHLEAASAARIGHWARGERKVPPYIAAHVLTHLELQECRRLLRAAGEEEEDEPP